MRELSEFEQDVLDRARNDYESPQTITADLTRDLGCAVSEEEVGAVFVLLATLGYVQAFEYDSNTRKFLPVSASSIAAVEDPWFLSMAHPMLSSRSNISSKPTPQSGAA
jgi:hypothetical protein